MYHRMYGVELQVPPGKLPGFYAQAVHRIGDAVPVFDRARQLLIVERPEDRQKLIEILDRYGMTGATVDLWLLPDGVDAGSVAANSGTGGVTGETGVSEAGAEISPWGFSSASGRVYLDASRVLPGRLDLSSIPPESRDNVRARLYPHVMVQLPVEHHDELLFFAERERRGELEEAARSYGASLIWDTSE